MKIARYFLILFFLQLFCVDLSWSQRYILPDTVSAGQLRVDEVMGMIDGNYVDTPDMNRMGDEALRAMLKALDPHSMYIPAKEVQRANEPLEGSGLSLRHKPVQSDLLSLFFLLFVVSMFRCFDASTFRGFEISTSRSLEISSFRYFKEFSIGCIPEVLVLRLILHHVC